MKQAIAAFDVSEDSPLTDRISFLPLPKNEFTTIAAFGAGSSELSEGVSWNEWLELFYCVARGFISTGVYVVPNETLYVTPTPTGWNRVQMRGDFSLHVSRLGQPDVVGARLMNQEGVVYQYLDSPSSGVTVFISHQQLTSSTITLSQSILDDEFEPLEAFAMTIDDDALLAMDAHDQEIEERHRAARERDRRAQAFDRN